MTITNPDPWSAVLSNLAQPAGVAITARPTGDAKPVAMIYSGRPWAVKLDTVELVKQRGLNGRRLYAVTFEDDGPYSPHLEFIGVEREDSGNWTPSGHASGSASQPVRATPWVNLSGWWGRGRFYAGGAVLGTDHARSVRLSSPDGTTLEDDTEAGIVLFIADHELERPVTLEICDETSHTIASQLDFELPD
jgi:hypothetical protein